MKSKPSYLGTAHPYAGEYNRMICEETYRRVELETNKQKALAIKLAEIKALQDEAEKINAEIAEKGATE